MAEDLDFRVPDQDELLAALERENRRRVWLPMLLLIVLPLLGATAIWRFGLTRSEVLEAEVEEEIASENGQRAIAGAVAEQLATPLGTEAIRGGVAEELLNNPQLRSGFERELSREIAGSEALRGALQSSIEAQLADSERLAASLASSVGAALERPEVRERLRLLAADELRDGIASEAVRERIASAVVEELGSSEEVAGAVRELAKREVDVMLDDEAVIRDLADEVAKSETFRRSLGGALWSDEAFRQRQRKAIADALGVADPAALGARLEAVEGVSRRLGQLEEKVGGMAVPDTGAADASRIRELRTELEERLAMLEANSYRSLPLREREPLELPALGIEVDPGRLLKEQDGSSILSGFTLRPLGGAPLDEIPAQLPLDRWHEVEWERCAYRFRVSEVSKRIFGLTRARLILEINRSCDNGG